MKRMYKCLAVAGLSAAVCLFLAMPAEAQHGGGGHGGGGGGGGHFGGGGGFSGGHVGTSFSGGRSAGSSAGFRGGFAQRSGVVQRGGFAASQRGSFAGAGRVGFSGGAVRGGFNGGRVGVGAYGRAGGFGAGRVGYGRGAYGGFGRGGFGRGGYGRSYGWGRHGGFYYNHGYFGSYYYPMLGFTCGYLPYGYYPFYWDDDQYYFSNGLYYTYDNNQYTVVEPPIGAAVNTLPTNAQSIVINGMQYYELNGVYYQPVTQDDGSITYQIAGKDGQLNTGDGGSAVAMPKMGDVVTTLPAESRKVRLNGATFYVSPDGIYYQEFTDANNNKAYKVVGVDAEQ